MDDSLSATIQFVDRLSHLTSEKKNSIYMESALNSGKIKVTFILAISDGKS